MASPLQHTLSQLTASRSRSNPAFDALLSSYVDYHVVLLVFGGLVELAVVALGVLAWIRARRGPRTATGRRTFEQRTYRAFALSAAIVGLAFAVVLAANVSTVADPWPGFDVLVTSLADPQAGTPTARLFTATDAWMRSGSPHAPAAVHAAVEHRLSRQRPRTIVSAVLMVLFGLLSVHMWRGLIERSRNHEGPRPARDRALTFLGTATVIAALLFTVLAVAHLRGTLEPVSITILQAGQGG